ncbi:MAG: hypothetical protein ABIP61_03145 [Burkholderiaceae bacterium]
MSRLALFALATTLAWLTACSPELDWREVSAEGDSLAALFPCRPDRLERTAAFGDAKVSMRMLVCSTGGSTYAIAFFDVADPARVALTLRDWRAIAVGNVRGVNPQLGPLQIGGMTPNPEALRLAVDGQFPDGAALREEAAFFSRGLRVYQATVVGARPTPQAVEGFFSGLRFLP